MTLSPNGMSALEVCRASGPNQAPTTGQTPPTNNLVSGSAKTDSINSSDRRRAANSSLFISITLLSRAMRPHGLSDPISRPTSTTIARLDAWIERSAANKAVRFILWARDRHFVEAGTHRVLSLSYLKPGAFFRASFVVSMVKYGLLSFMVRLTDASRPQRPFHRRRESRQLPLSQH